ncbi:MAG: hypothetical protein ACJ76Y_26710 [Thermoanaerobaculia bacterium]
MAVNLETKSNKRKLRQLAGVAHERELGAELSKLEAEFARWRRGEIDPFELSDRIHRFHDGVSRDLYVLYGRLPPSHSVARAVALEVLREAEVPSEFLEALERPLLFYREQLTEPSERADQDED